MLQEDCTAAFAAIPAALSPTVAPLLQLTLAHGPSSASSGTSASSPAQPLISISAASGPRDHEHDSGAMVLVAFTANTIQDRAATANSFVCVVRVAPPPDRDGASVPVHVRSFAVCAPVTSRKRFVHCLASSQ